jgi:ATP-dependent helicase Lhr and Lhr-like helicase
LKEPTSVVIYTRAGTRPSGSDILLFPWEGDRTHDTLALLLTRHGISACREGVAINASAGTVNDLRHALQAITEGPPPVATDLAVGINGAASDKHDVYLGEGLLAAAYAARALDVSAALDTARRLLAVLTPDNIAKRPAASSPASLRTLDTIALKLEPTIATRDAVFSVVDVETTGFSPALGDRIVEIGIVRLAGDGTILDTLETLINPQRLMKATFLHGITDADIENAPTFADIAADVAERLAGTVVTAHNAPFDVEFLAAEFGRLGREDPISATACTLQLAHRFLPNLASHKLDACAAAEGVTLERHHSALADASAAAALLTKWLRRARQDGAETLADLQIATPDHPTSVSARIEAPRRPLTARSRLDAARPETRDSAAAVVPSIGGQLYELALAQALADGDVTDIERRELDLLAAQWNLTAAEQERLLQAATRQSRPATPPA